jgi:hypothetical protein
MKWRVTSPTVPTQIIDLEIVAAHLRVDLDAENTDYIYGLIAAAIDYAEEAVSGSIAAKTIEATFYVEDVGLTPAVTTQQQTFDPFATPVAAVSAFGAYGRSPALRLPRGPVNSIVSVTDGSGTHLTGYALERVGNADRMRLNVAATYPVTVTYTAGYEVEDIPPAILQAILTHVGTLYENRESVGRDLKAVPHSLESFYRMKSRRSGVA